MEMNPVYDSRIQSWFGEKVYRFAEGLRVSCGEGIEILIASIEMFSCIRHGLGWSSLRSSSKKTTSYWESGLKTGVSRITEEPYLTQVAAEARSPWGPSLLSSKLIIEAYSLTACECNLNDCYMRTKHETPMACSVSWDNDSFTPVVDQLLTAIQQGRNTLSDW